MPPAPASPADRSNDGSRTTMVALSAGVRRDDAWSTFPRVAVVPALLAAVLLAAACGGASGSSASTKPTPTSTTTAAKPAGTVAINATNTPTPGTIPVDRHGRTLDRNTQESGR